MSEEPATSDWRTQLAGVTAVVDVPGNHSSMMEERLDTTVAAIHDRLAGLVS